MGDRAESQHATTPHIARARALAALFRRATDGALQLALPELRVLEANPVACRMLARRREEVLERPLAELLSIESVVLDDLARSIAATGRADAMLHLPDAVGRPLAVELSAILLEPTLAVALLVYVAAPHHAPPAHTTPVPPPVDAPVVLLVDDESALRSLGRRILERQGFVVVEAETGDDALRIAASIARLDVLVTDLLMPGMDGRELADRLTRTRDRLGVLFLSGGATQDLERAVESRPAASWLQKPFTPAELGGKLRELIARLG
ncbi:MAG TPA: response regulator [Gemmatimonadaceae bacterium]|nr:response regulator [Gemmatimonadaceae bacterium]